MATKKKKGGSVDLDELRASLRQMDRGDLLFIAERTFECLSRAGLETLMRDILYPPSIEEDPNAASTLLEEVRKFHDASLQGEYYESFNVNSKNWRQTSRGTENFIAEFDRLTAKCLSAATAGSHTIAREALELLFELLRRIDEDPDSIVFFADEAGSWQVGVDWRTVLPVYFQCLAHEAPGDEFAQAVDRVITDFRDHERPALLKAARSVANAEQKAALSRAGRRNKRV